VRCGRWALPPGVAALAAEGSRGPLLLVSSELSEHEAIAAGALVLALFTYQSVALISKDDLAHALQQLEMALA